MRLICGSCLTTGIGTTADFNGGYDITPTFLASGANPSYPNAFSNGWLVAIDDPVLTASRGTIPEPGSLALLGLGLAGLGFSRRRRR